MIKDSEYEKWLKLMRSSVTDTKKGRGHRGGGKTRAASDVVIHPSTSDDPLLALYERLRAVRRAC